ncbi:MAG: hypothetical protein JEZ12_08580 [Desulfobacterium sp.]|nr:hypothetical protein [Desulfobacterium sp.]
MMKNILSVVATLAILTGLTTNLFAAEPAAKEAWQIAYTAALVDGKANPPPQGQALKEGLAYTPPEEMVLKEAVSKAMEKEASACECMKIAIDLEYNPYAVLKAIYSSEGNVQLDQLCMCATEAGIMKAITAKAAVDSLSSSGAPLFQQDEITQSQCLGGEEGRINTPPEEGLAYTAPVVPLKTISTDANKNRNFATSTTF